MQLRLSSSGPVVKLASFAAPADNVNVGAVATIDWSKGPAQRLTLSANATVTFIGQPPGERAWFQLEIVQGGAGSFVPTFVNTLTPGGTPLTFSTAPGSLDVVSVYWSGTRSLAATAGLAFG